MIMAGARSMPLSHPSEENSGRSFENKKLLFPVREKENRLLAVCNFAIYVGLQCSPIARPHDVLCVARIERSHSHDADSHIRYSSFPAREFCHRRRRHCAGRRCHNSVGLSLRNTSGGTYTGTPMLPSVHCGTYTYEIQSRCRKMKHPLSMFRNGSSSDSGNFMLPWFKSPRSVQKKNYIRDMNNIRARARESAF